MKRRQTTGAVLLALLLMLTVTLSAVPVTAEAGTLTLDKTTYTEGEDILVTATGSGADWVGLYGTMSRRTVTSPASRRTYGKRSSGTTAVPCWRFLPGIMSCSCVPMTATPYWRRLHLP